MDEPDTPYAPSSAAPGSGENRSDDTQRPYNGASFRTLIPDEQFVVLCRHITGATNMSRFADESFDVRFAALTRQMRLAGREALRDDGEGSFLLVEQLHGAMPWMEKVIDRLELHLRIQRWAGRPWLHFAPICLVGPPGAGKSHLARMIGDLAGIGHAALDLGGTSDNRALEGTARGFTQAQPAWPILMIDRLRIANPVLVVEEIDKAGGSSRNGRPLDTLLAMLEPVSAARYHDKCLIADVDLSHVNWLLTCNTIEALPSPLRSRVEVIAVEPPDADHFDLIERSLRTRLARRWEVPFEDLPELPPAALEVLRAAFARERSVRKLQRHLESVIAALVPARRSIIH